jgi:hypothetical protein
MTCKFKVHKTGCASYPHGKAPYCMVQGKADGVLGAQHRGCFFGRRMAHRPFKTHRLFFIPVAKLTGFPNRALQ